MRQKKRIDSLLRWIETMDKDIMLLQRDNKALKHTNELLGNVLFDNYKCSIPTTYPGPILKDQFKKD